MEVEVHPCLFMVENVILLAWLQKFDPSCHPRAHPIQLVESCLSNVNAPIKQVESGLCDVTASIQPVESGVSAVTAPIQPVKSGVSDVTAPIQPVESGLSDVTAAPPLNRLTSSEELL